MQTKIIGFITGLIAALLVACGSATVAHNGPSQADFQLALNRIQQLETQIEGRATTVAVEGIETALVARLEVVERDLGVTSGNVVSVSPVPGTRRSKADEDAAVVGVLLGFSPTPIGSTRMFVGSTTGYKVPFDPTDPTPSAAYIADLWYESTDCSGPAYVRFGMNQPDADQGLVFRKQPSEASASSYFMVRAGTQQTNGLNLLSRFDGNTPACETLSPPPGVPLGGWLAEPNDVAVTGIPSAEFPTKLKFGKPSP
jgi:hypothetical protein